VDEGGLVHFSNVPVDPRYRRVKSGYTFRPAVTASRNQIETLIEKTSHQHRVDPALVRAMVRVESDFNPLALSSAGAMGLMQLMPKTASRFDVRNPYDPAQNLEGGTRYLRRLMDLFRGDLALALSAYHAGEGLVKQIQKIPNIRQTQQYVKRVLKFYQEYRRRDTQGSSSRKIYKIVTAKGEVTYTNSPSASTAGQSHHQIFVR
jgi:soluble lytic murein transglycosylase